MPHRKPLSITSPDNAVALSTYFMLGLAGILFVLGTSSNSAMHKAAGSEMTDVWSVILMLSNGSAFFAAMGARKAYRPERLLKVEGWCALASGLALAVFMFLVIRHFGASALGTISFAAAFAVGQILRALQIKSEIGIIKIARQYQVKASPVLADPRDDTVGQ